MFDTKSIQIRFYRLSAAGQQVVGLVGVVVGGTKLQKKQKKLFRGLDIVGHEVQRGLEYH